MLRMMKSSFKGIIYVRYNSVCVIKSRNILDDWCTVLDIFLCKYSQWENLVCAVLCTMRFTVVVCAKQRRQKKEWLYPYLYF